MADHVAEGAYHNSTSPTIQGGDSMTPPTPEQIKALEQWARDGKRIAGDPHAMVLALIASWREGQQRVDWQHANAQLCEQLDRVTAERDAALTDLAQARQEREEADMALAACQSQTEGIIARLEGERDKALDMLADEGKPLARLSMPQVHRNVDVIKALRARESEAKATIASLREEKEWWTAVNAALLPCQERAVKAEAENATLREQLAAAQALLHRASRKVLCEHIPECEWSKPWGHGRCTTSACEDSTIFGDLRAWQEAQR